MRESSRPSALLDDARPIDFALRDIDDLMVQLDDLARTIDDAEDFREQLLSMLTTSVSAKSGTIWWQCDQTLDCAASVAREGPAPSSQSLGLAKFVAETASTGNSIRHEVDPSELLYLQPILNQPNGILGVLEISIRPERDRSEIAAIIAAVSEIIADHFHRTTILRLQESTIQGESINRFTSELYAGRDMQAMAFNLVNAGRDLIRCDRLSLLIREAGRYRIHGVSGVDTINARSQSIRNIEHLADKTTIAGDDFWFSGETDDLPPQLTTLAESVIDSNHCRRFAILPIQSEDEAQPIGALFVEFFSSSEERDAQDRIAVVRKHAAIAIQQSLRIEQVPFWNVWQTLQLRKSLKRTAKSGLHFAIAGIVASIVLSLPTEFSVEATGTLQPVTQRHIFAPTSGEITELLVEHGARVKKGEALLTIDSADISQLVHDLEGRVEATRERLGAIRVARMEGKSHAEPNQVHRDSAEQTALSAELSSLEAQLQIAKKQQDSLELRSPFDGEVITWDLKSRLAHRPVQPGDNLLTVANTRGDWHLRIRIPEIESTHVVSSLGKHNESGAVSIQLESDPGRVIKGNLVELSTVAAQDNVGNHYLPATVALAQADLPNSLRAGSPARVRLNCGQRSVAFVWFHELIDAIQMHLVF